MNQRHPTPSAPELDLTRWQLLPWAAVVAGGFGAAMGGLTDLKHFGYSWLLSFAFFLSLSLGALFLVMMHHLFDSAWSSPIRRVVEHIACLSFPALFLLFLPIAVLAPRLYPWISSNQAGQDAWGRQWTFYVTAALCFAAWGTLSNRLRHWSLRQDKNGMARCTQRMRTWSAGGIFLFATTLTLAAVLWIKALTPDWVSTMYGVWYFAASLWVTIATVYALTALLHRAGPLRQVVHEKQFYFLGSLFFAFTLFYGYITYSQYFVIWNGNLPEETFWYTLRERGTWRLLSILLIFGHFFLPFLCLMRMDWKLKMGVMLPLCAWAWLMHFCDLQFQIMPIAHPEGVSVAGLRTDLSCLVFMGGMLTLVFIHSFKKHPACPQRDPRMVEALGLETPNARVEARLKGTK